MKMMLTCSFLRQENTGSPLFFRLSPLLLSPHTYSKQQHLTVPFLPLSILTSVLHLFSFCSTSASSFSLNSASAFANTHLWGMLKHLQDYLDKLEEEKGTFYIHFGPTIFSKLLSVFNVSCHLSAVTFWSQNTHKKNIITINNGAGRLSAFPPTFFSHFCFLRCLFFLSALRNIYFFLE